MASVDLGPDVALIAGLMGEPARAAILVALVNGKALPAGELAFIGNIAPQTASFHLRKLMDASLITLEKQGKHSYYRLANERVASTLESLAALAPMRRQNRYESARVKELRFARSCYRHLAGVVAVNIHQALMDRGLLMAGADGTYCVTDRGEEWCRDLGVSVNSGRACLDWTERRPHIGGPLGAALFTRFLDMRWIARKPETRAVRVTHLGARALEERLGIRAF